MLAAAAGEAVAGAGAVRKVSWGRVGLAGFCEIPVWAWAAPPGVDWRDGRNARDARDGDAGFRPAAAETGVADTAASKDTGREAARANATAPVLRG